MKKGWNRLKSVPHFPQETMPELPATVMEYLNKLVLSQSRPAYLLIDQGGNLGSWGGHTEDYGLKDLKRGEPISQQIYFLEGLLPLKGDDFSLSCIQTDSGRPADLYLFSTPEGDCALLL